MAFSFSKLKRMLSSKLEEATSSRLDPEVGFKIAYDSNINEINVIVIGARHLPTTFGIKVASGYSIKVKLFPGTAKFETKTLPQSWPTFNEKFKFSVRNQTSSSKSTDPLQVLNGHFFTFTVYATLENIDTTTLADQTKEKYKLVKDKMKKDKDSKEKKESVKREPFVALSERRRTVGAVTWMFDLKMFEETTALNKVFVTREIWGPIKEIGVGIAGSKAPNNESRKGQIELIISYGELKAQEAEPDKRGNLPTKSTSSVRPISTSSKTSKLYSRSESEVKSSAVTNPFDSDYSDDDDIFKTKEEPKMILNVTTSRMRCSAHVKEEFELAGGQIYVKTVVQDDDRTVTSWTSTKFHPTLSTRWDSTISTLTTPISETNLPYTTIKCTVAIKNKMNKKIVLGTVIIGPKSKGKCLEHWDNVMKTPGQGISDWHNFE